MGFTLKFAAALWLFVVIFNDFVNCESVFEGSIVHNQTNNDFKFVNKYDRSAVAYGRFRVNQETDGWNYLNLTSTSSFTEASQAYAAGYVEGSLTKNQIYMTYVNSYMSICNPGSAECEQLEEFMNENMKWMHSMIEKNKGSTYWHQVSLLLYQVKGIEDGYFGRDVVVSNNVEPFKKGSVIFQLSGDFEDLGLKFSVPNHKVLLSDGGCSALVKHVGHDLYTSHVTWSSYNTMLRVVKRYDFPFKLLEASSPTDIPGKVTVFTSYPGSVVSTDDYYQMGSNLVVQETTISNNNKDLYRHTTPTTLLYWLRIMLANRLATTGDEWASIFGRHNSGTYNNQWIVVNYNLFVPGKPLPDNGLLTILEQLPGMIVTADKSTQLKETGYWASYNSPYFKDIFLNGKFQDQVDKFGDFFSYANCPRAKIFRRDHIKVKDMQSMINLMRYNDFRNDPLSRCNCTPPYSGENGISARCDLNPKTGTYPFEQLSFRCHGGTDMKLTNSSMVALQAMVAVSGPTYQTAPVFDWSSTPCNNMQSHMGLPVSYKFSPVYIVWN